MRIEYLTIDNCHNTLWQRRDDIIIVIRRSGSSSNVKTVVVYDRTDDKLFYTWMADSIEAIRHNLAIYSQYHYIGQYEHLDWESYLEEVKNK